MKCIFNSRDVNLTSQKPTPEMKSCLAMTSTFFILKMTAYYVFLGYSTKMNFIILLCLSYALSLSSSNTSFILQAIFLKLNPMYLMFPTAIATSFAFMLPVATPPNAVVFSYGYVKVIDMVRHLIFLSIHMCNLLNCEYYFIFISKTIILFFFTSKDI